MADEVRCPVHGAPIVEPDKATAEELHLLLEEQIRSVPVMGRSLMTLDLYGKAQFIRNLLERYDVRRR